MFEDDAPKPPKLDLDRMSVEDLQEHIETLKAEIAACQAEIEKKKAHKSAADDFFKT